MSTSPAVAQTSCVAAVADLSLTKTVNDATPTIGGQVTFTVKVTNHGPDQARNVAVRDPLPAGLTFVSATPSQGAYNAGTGIWTVGTLDDDHSATLRIIATVASSTTTNTAQVSASDQTDPDSTPDNNDATEDDQDSVTVNPAPPPPPAADLSLTKTVSDATPTVGDQVSFTVKVTNVGPQQATNVAVRDVLPAGLTFVSASPSQGAYNAGTGVWTVGTLDDDHSATLQIIATVASSTTTNTAQVSASDQADPDSTPNNNDPTEDDQDSVTVTPAPAPSTNPPTVPPAGMSVDNPPSAIAGNPPVAPGSGASSVPASRPAGSPQVAAGAPTDGAKLSIRKRSTRASITSGKTVRFRITVRSVGSTAALNVRVCDRLPSGLTYVSAGGARFRAGVACWTIARLAPGAVRHYSITARADQLVGGDARRIRNVATADASNTPKVSHAAAVRVRPGQSAVLASGVTG